MNVTLVPLLTVIEGDGSIITLLLADTEIKDIMKLMKNTYHYAHTLHTNGRKYIPVISAEVDVTYSLIIGVVTTQRYLP